MNYLKYLFLTLKFALILGLFAGCSMPEEFYAIRFTAKGASKDWSAIRESFSKTALAMDALPDLYRLKRKADLQELLASHCNLGTVNVSGYRGRETSKLIVICNRDSEFVILAKYDDIGKPGRFRRMTLPQNRWMMKQHLGLVQKLQSMLEKKGSTVGKAELHDYSWENSAFEWKGEGRTLDLKKLLAMELPRAL